MYAVTFIILTNTETENNSNNMLLCFFSLT